MSFDAHANFAYSTVATAPSPATSGTSLTVATGDGSKFPAAPFNATVWPANQQPTTANAEIVRVTAAATDTLTITRAQESSSARSIIVGDQIAATITSKTVTDIEAARSELNYTQRTTTLTVASVTEATGTTVLSPGAITFNGNPVIVEFYASLCQTPASAPGAKVVVSLFEGSTQITRLCAAFCLITTDTDDTPLYGRYRFTPSAGSHTYTVTAYADSTTGAPAILAGSGGTGGYPPCFVRFVYA